MSDLLGYLLSTFKKNVCLLNFKRVTGMLDLGQWHWMQIIPHLQSNYYLYGLQHRQLMAILCLFDLEPNKLRRLCLPKMKENCVCVTIFSNLGAHILQIWSPFLHIWSHFTQIWSQFVQICSRFRELAKCFAFSHI